MRIITLTAMSCIILGIAAIVFWFWHNYKDRAVPGKSGVLAIIATVAFPLWITLVSLMFYATASVAINKGTIVLFRCIFTILTASPVLLILRLMRLSMQPPNKTSGTSPQTLSEIMSPQHKKKRPVRKQ